MDDAHSDPCLFRLEYNRLVRSRVADPNHLIMLLFGWLDEL